ncbi:PREDICTED: putative F-box protein At1g67390 [Camelina sativa]|uniref:F-box protein At1g67390 n=1 Tax=Camelina sativa TaxID=90675 RepID=A0ABM0VL70_CAMSA|nr:PREDICTED: putative F-box protein At1g67390 [Camelina sativa]
MAASSSTVSSDARGKKNLLNVDRISMLPDEVLLMILEKIPTEEAVRTSLLSTRWKGVWKYLPSLIFDMRKTCNAQMGSLADRSGDIADLITKIINNHKGHLEYCRIHHFSYQSKDGALEAWIRTLIHVKGTKSLSLLNHLGHNRRASMLHLLPNTFSHPALTSLSLYRYDFETANPFNKCDNLMILQLGRICAEVGVFNTIIAACPSLKVLVLEITAYSQVGCLKIHNNNLKLLHVTCSHIDRIDVSAPLLDIFSIRFTFVTKDNFLLAAPRVLQINKSYWAAKARTPHISYNISGNAQEKESIEHKFVVSRDTNYLVRFQSLAVIVDLMNPREVQMLREVLVAWNGIMRKLEISFTDTNIPKKEGESSISGAEKKKWEDGQIFPNADFRVDVLWMFNFNGCDENQFELASRFVTQGTVMRKMMIKTSLIPPSEETEAAVAKLMELPKGNEELSIELCF